MRHPAERPAAYRPGQANDSSVDRQGVARLIAADYGGVASRQALITSGMSTGTIRAEVNAGRWWRLGVHTIGIGASAMTQAPALWWWAVWEAGPGAMLDGASALQASGLTGWEERDVHVSVPHKNAAHPRNGLIVHRPRCPGPAMGAGVPRVRPEVAVIRGAQWARTDRAAATLVAMAIQQRVTSPDRVLAAWAEIRRSRRRVLLSAVIGDVCDGAQSLGELDFAALCRARGLPQPTRQAVCRGPKGRIYLDALWEDIGLHVEIDGVQHFQALAPVDDALRQNAVALQGAMTLRIPVLGLRLQPGAFMDQVGAAHATASLRTLGLR
ncbi:MAG: hypothetical protein WA991_07555 [Ornithinimicrobium sp.]